MGTWEQRFSGVQVWKLSSNLVMDQGEGKWGKSIQLDTRSRHIIWGWVFLNSYASGKDESKMNSQMGDAWQVRKSTANHLFNMA